MSRLPLTPDQAELSGRIDHSLRQAADADLRLLADLLAPKPDRQLLGQTEFEVRDLVHTIGATAFETALDERKKGGIKGLLRAARTATSRPGSSRIAPMSIQSLAATFRLDRAYYHCRSCGAGTVPLGRGPRPACARR